MDSGKPWKLHLYTVKIHSYRSIYKSNTLKDTFILTYMHYTHASKSSQILSKMSALKQSNAKFRGKRNIGCRLQNVTTSGFLTICYAFFLLYCVTYLYWVWCKKVEGPHEDCTWLLKFIELLSPQIFTKLSLLITFYTAAAYLGGGGVGMKPKKNVKFKCKI
jgi:hypothetical protein